MNYNNIQFKEDAFIAQMNAMKEAAEALELPMLRATRDSTTAGLQYIPAVYNNFKDIVSKYILLFKRDLHNISQKVVNLVETDMAYSMSLNTLDSTTFQAQSAHLNSLLYEDVNAELAEYTVAPAAHVYSDWVFKLTELNEMVANVGEELGELIDRINTLTGRIDVFVNSNSISGAGANDMKSYFREIHSSLCYGIVTAAQAVPSELFTYWRMYYDTAPLSYNGSEYTIDKGGMRAFLNSLDDVINSLRSINANFSYATTNLYIDSNYALDYTDLLPDIQLVLPQYHRMDDLGGSIVDAIDANENYLISIQSAIDEPIQCVVEQINSLVNVETAANGAYNYFSDNTVEQVNINEYNETYAEIRANTEANVEDICWGYTRAGEVNTEFEATIQELHDEQDMIICIMSVLFDVLGLGELAFETGGRGFQWSMGLVSLGMDSGMYDEYLYMFVYMLGGDEELYETLSALSGTLMDFVNAGINMWNLELPVSPSDVLLSLDSDTLIMLETVTMLVLRDRPAEAAIVMLEDSGIPRNWAEWAVYAIEDNCPVDLDTIPAYSPAEFIMTVTGLLPDGPWNIESRVSAMETAEDVLGFEEGADIIEQHLEVENYEAYLDDYGYDEARLREMGLIG